MNVLRGSPACTLLPPGLLQISTDSPPLTALAPGLTGTSTSGGNADATGGCERHGGDRFTAAVASASVVVAGGIRHDTAIGGSDTFLADCEAYDPASDSWHPLPPLTYPRGGGVAMLLPGMLLAGCTPERCAPGDVAGVHLEQADAAAGRASVGSIGVRMDSLTLHKLGDGENHAEGSGDGGKAAVVVMGGYGSARVVNLGRGGNEHHRRALLRPPLPPPQLQQQLQPQQYEQAVLQAMRHLREVPTPTRQQDFGLPFADVLASNASGSILEAGSQWVRSEAMWLPNVRQAVGPIATVHSREGRLGTVRDGGMGAAWISADGAGAGDDDPRSAAAALRVPLQAAISGAAAAATAALVRPSSTAFMLSGNAILRFDPPSCKWLPETNLARADPLASFFALNGELYVVPSTPRTPVRRTPPFQHVYSLATGTWRTMPLQQKLQGIRSDTAVSCGAATLTL